MKTISDESLCERCRKLAGSECSFNDEGVCLMADRPCESLLVNPAYRIEDGAINCEWFIDAVLPLDPELNETIGGLINRVRDLYDADRPPILLQCADCGKYFTPHSNRQKRCKACAGEAHKKADAKWHRYRYWQD